MSKSGGLSTGIIARREMQGMGFEFYVPEADDTCMETHGDEPGGDGVGDYPFDFSTIASPKRIASEFMTI